MSKTKQRLGKGLGALLPDVESSRTSLADSKEKPENLRYLDPRLIKANPFQPRSEFDHDSLEELKQSIKENGLIQPLVVRQIDDDFELIAGERRLRAVLDLGYTEVAVFLRDVSTDQEMLEIALIENIQRENLNVVELANSYRQLIEECKLTIEELAKRIGKDRSTINNILRLLKLPVEILKLLKENLLSSGHGRTLLALVNKSDQIRVAKIAIKNNLSVRQLEVLVKKVNSGEHEIKKKSTYKDPYYNKLESQFMNLLGTKVSINPKKKGGLIEVHYYSDDDLGRISELIDKLGS